MALALTNVFTQSYSGFAVLSGAANAELILICQPTDCPLKS